MEVFYGHFKGQLMKWTPENGKDKIVIDEMGKQVPYVVTFDDETQEAQILIKGKNGIIVAGGEMLKVTVKIPGAKVVDKDSVV